MAKLTDEERDTILISMNENIKAMKQDQSEMKHALAKRPTRDEVVTIIRRELAEYPKTHEVREIVRDELQISDNLKTSRIPQ